MALKLIVKLWALAGHSCVSRGSSVWLRRRDLLQELDGTGRRLDERVETFNEPIRYVQILYLLVSLMVAS